MIFDGVNSLMLRYAGKVLPLEKKFEVWDNVSNIKMYATLSVHTSGITLLLSLLIFDVVCLF